MTPDAGGDGSPPPISVVTRTHNSAEYVGRSLESIQAQTIDDDRYEHVVIDDGSTDDTVETVREHPADVRLIETEHTGAMETLNAGVGATRGRYLIVLDADDTFEPSALERLYETIETTDDADFVYSDYHEETVDGERRYVDTGENIFNTITIGILFRSDAVEAVGRYDESMLFPEYDLLVKLRRAGFEGLHVAEPLFTYIRRDDSLTADDALVERGMAELTEKYGDLDIREY